MSGETVNPITVIRRRDRSGITNYDLLFREFRESNNMMRDIITPHNARSLMEYILGKDFKKRHCIRSVIVENDDTNKYECNICYEECEKRCFVKLNCGHEFCGKCIKKSLENTHLDIKVRCAYCRTDINTIEFSSEETKSEFSDLLSDDSI